MALRPNVSFLLFRQRSFFEQASSLTARLLHFRVWQWAEHETVPVGFVMPFIWLVTRVHPLKIATRHV